MTGVDVRLLISAATILVDLLLAFIVYQNNRRSATNVIFSCLSVVTSLWLADVFLSVDPEVTSHALLWVRISVFLATPQIVLFFLLAHTLPSERIRISKGQFWLLITVMALVMLDTLSPFTFKGVKIVGSSVQALPGPGIALFAVFAVVMSLSAVYTVIRKLLRSKGNVKEQYLYMVSGLISLFVLLIVTVLIPVVVFKYSGLVPLVPLYTIIFLGLTTYAIIKKQLFNIRAVVAKSVAYLLLLLIFAILYGVYTFQIANFLFGASKLSEAQKILNVALAMVLGLSLQPLKRSIDRLTNRIFFKDAYDPQQLFNSLNQALVSTLEIDTLLQRALAAIEASLKTEMGLLVITDSLGKHHVVSANGPLGDKFDHGDLELVHSKHFVSRSASAVMVTDQLEDNKELRRVLAKNHIAAMARIGGGDKTKEMGHLILGDKKSGDPYSAQDIRVIETIVNELAIAIQNALRFEEIHQFNETLQNKITNATKQLSNSNHRLRELDSTKDEFISMASHQLRTPLTSVKGYLSMVLDGDAGEVNDNQRKLLEQAFRSSQQMVFLISDLLNLSRINTGKFVIEPSQVNLSEVVQAEIEQLTETAKSRGVNLTYDKPASFPDLMLDETKIHQVIMNFIDNAIYYTKTGGTVTVGLHETPTAVEYTVADNGIGVPKSVQHRLFTKFYRADNAQKARPDGTGLGLFMAKKVIVAQGGSIIFESEEGKGSTFGFRFNKATHKVPVTPAQH